MTKTGTTNIPLYQLQLRPSTRALLQKRGFTSSADLEKSSQHGGIGNLAAELSVSLLEAAGLLREVSQAVATSLGTFETGNKQLTTNKRLISNTITASELLTAKDLESPSQTRSIITFSRSVDGLLGGGIALGEVTEVAGLPGAGKTQLAMQLCVDASIPQLYGGVAGQAVYIDTEGSFSPERCFSMAEALVDHVKKTAGRRRRRQVLEPLNSTPRPPPLDDFSAHNVLRGIHVFRVYDEAAQTATIFSLSNFLEKQAQQGTPVRVVIVDSIAFHYRCAPRDGDYIARTRALAKVASRLTDLSRKFDVAVVTVNQMTTKFIGDSGTEDTRFAPALGESWAHSTTSRIVLTLESEFKPDGPRICRLLKSPHRAQGHVKFKVLQCGIRDAAAPEPRRPVQSGVVEAAKRLRTQY